MTCYEALASLVLAHFLMVYKSLPIQVTLDLIDTLKPSTIEKTAQQQEEIIKLVSSGMFANRKIRGNRYIAYVNRQKV